MIILHISPFVKSFKEKFLYYILFCLTSQKLKKTTGLRIQRMQRIIKRKNAVAKPRHRDIAQRRFLTLFRAGHMGHAIAHAAEQKLFPGVITGQPESIKVKSGETVQFKVSVEGEVKSYKWEYRKIFKWFNTSMEGYNTDTLTVQ